MAIVLPLSAAKLSFFLKNLVQSSKNIKFGKILYQLKQKHTFKYPSKQMQELYSLCELGLSDELARWTYVIVASNILKEYSLRENIEKNMHYFMKNKPCPLVSSIQDFEQKIGKELRASYCVIMETLKQRKSEIMEFLLFLIYFSSKNVIANICQSIMSMREYVEQSLKSGTDEIGKIACMIMNYKITGIKVSRTVYKTLKSKFYRQKFQKSQGHDENLSDASEKKNKLVNALDTPCIKHHGMQEDIKHSFVRSKSKKPTKVYIRIDEQSGNEDDNESYAKTKQQKQLLNDIKQILTEKITTRLDKSQRKAHFHKKKNHDRKRLSENPNQVCGIEERSIKLLGFATYRNSEAFKQKRNAVENKNIEKQGYSSLDLKNNKKPKVIYSKSKVQIKTEMEIKNINANLKLLFEKKDKKSHHKQVHKRSVLQWEKKVNDLQHFKNVDRAQFIVPGSKWHQRRNSQEEYENTPNTENYYSNKTSRKVIETINFEGATRSGFCEFIDISEPSQIGIVKSIINFQNHRPDYQFKKISPKGLKDDLQEFNKKAQQVYDNCFDETQFELRLQKVLSSKIR